MLFNRKKLDRRTFFFELTVNKEIKKKVEIRIVSSGFILILIQNILNQGYTSVHQEKKVVLSKVKL